MVHSSAHGMFIRRTGDPAAAVTVLYIHGLGESGLCFERLASRRDLSGHRHLIPDLPGYGRSIWPEQPLRLYQLADHLADWLEERGEGPVVVVGHSMGGVLGTRFCESHPRRARAFVNVEGNLSPGDCVFSSQAVRRSLAAFEADGFDAMRDRIYRDGLERPALRGYYASLRLCDPRCYHLNSGELVQLSAPEDLAHRLAGLDLPRYYIAGVPDGVCDRSVDLLRAEGIEPIRVSPSGHWPFIDQEDRFALALGRILDSIGESAAKA